MNREVCQYKESLGYYVAANPCESCLSAWFVDDKCSLTRSWILIRRVCSLTYGVDLHLFSSFVCRLILHYQWKSIVLFSNRPRCCFSVKLNALVLRIYSVPIHFVTSAFEILEKKCWYAWSLLVVFIIITNFFARPQTETVQVKILLHARSKVINHIDWDCIQTWLGERHLIEVNGTVALSPFKDALGSSMLLTVDDIKQT